MLIKSREMKPNRKIEVAREPESFLFRLNFNKFVKEEYHIQKSKRFLRFEKIQFKMLNNCSNIIKMTDVIIIKKLLTRVKSSSIDVPLYPHSGITHRFDSGLEVDSSTLDLMDVFQWYDETRRWINSVLLGWRQIWLGAFHVSQINHLGARRWSAINLIFISFPHKWKVSLILSFIISFN